MAGAPGPARYDRRRALLQLALVAQAGAAGVLIWPAVVGARPARGPDTRPSPPPAHVTNPTPTPTPPASLTLGDGRTVALLGSGLASTDALLTRVGREIGPAVEAVVAFWGADWQRDVIVVAAGSAEQFRELTHGPAGSVDIAAAAVADSVDPARRIATGQLVVFAPGAYAMSDTALRIMLRHELFHFASRADTALDAPRWLTEGVADFVARPATARPGPGGGAAELAQLPTDADFSSSGAALTLAYDRAWWFARFVADAYGIATLRRLYLRAGGSGHPDPATALAEVLHADEAVLLTRMQRWLAS